MRNGTRAWKRGPSRFVAAMSAAAIIVAMGVTGAAYAQTAVDAGSLSTSTGDAAQAGASDQNGVTDAGDAANGDTSADTGTSDGTSDGASDGATGTDQTVTNDGDDQQHATDGTGTSDGTASDGATGDADTSDTSNAGSSTDAATGTASAASRAANADYDKYLVANDNVNPSGTSVNLFNYWTNAGATDDLTVTGKDGINKNRTLQFNTGGGLGINDWTDSARPYFGLVDTSLGEDGYPVLVKNENGSAASTPSSLDYLFDGSSFEGKQSYMGVKGMLQYTDDGYYYYNAKAKNADMGLDGNFASYNAQTNRFDLYNSWAVMPHDGNVTSVCATIESAQGQDCGQFFPFNTASEVFTSDVSGDTPVAAQLKDNATSLNHHFGLSMSTRFKQADGGTNAQSGGEPMTYQFSGDDDVWVFIDDVLVGDLGGIHNAASLKIDFSTGEVLINDGDAATGKSTTLRQLYVDAGKESVTSWRGDTFADETIHRLKFFYLERGAYASNMSLKFNLVTVPESNIIKVDQDGNGVAGAEFALYATDDKYTMNGNQPTVASGATDANGDLTLTDDTGNLISFDELAGQGMRNFVLEETTVPDGYRKPSANMQLRYIVDPNQSDASGPVGAIISDPGLSREDGNAWQTGSLATAKEVVRAPDDVYKCPGGVCETTPLTDAELEQGQMFAVILQQTADGNWRAVYGDQLNGWTATEDSGMASIVDAYQGSHAVDFKMSQDGQWQALIDELPGDIQDYYYWAKNDATPEYEYTVAFYYSSAAKKEDVTANNTYRLNVDDFGHEFSVNLYVANTRNTVSVQKVDDAGKPVDGAEFGLFAADDVTCTPDPDTQVETCAPKESASPLDTVTTADHTEADTGEQDDTGATSTARTQAGATIAKFKASGTFPNNNGSNLMVDEEYYIIETAAPEGYVINTEAVKVAVTNEGVFVDAGTKDDGVTVIRGVGNLVQTMAYFGSSPDVNGTLTWLKATPELRDDTGTGLDVTGGSVSAARVVNGEIVDATAYDDTNGVRVEYGADGTVLEYGPREKNGNLVYVTDEHWLTTKTEQDDPGANYNADKYVNLKHMDRLSGLMTGSALVRVANPRITATAKAGVRKTVRNMLWGTSTYYFTFRAQNEGPMPVGGEIDPTTGEETDACPTRLDGISCEMSLTTPEEGEGGTSNEGLIGTFHFTWDDIKDVKPDANGTRTKDFTYTLNEQNTPDHVDISSGTMVFSQARYTITITLTYTRDDGLSAKTTMTRTVTDGGAADSTVIAPETSGELKDVSLASFVNTYVAVASLPFTGGTAAMDWLKIGATLAMLAMLACAGYRIWNKRTLLL